MGEVWAGTDLLLRRTVAVKVMHEHLAVDETARVRFEREARAVASLNHPCIAAVYDAGSLPLVPSRPYMVMEYVSGETLADQLLLGLPSMAEALGWADGILAALECAHAAGVVHRDIKPANVMVTRSGLVKVMDFGIVHVIGAEHSTLTSTHTVVGTAAYMAPEQAQGRLVDARSDLYAVGCLLYELLTGRPPYQGEMPLDVMYQHVHEQPVPPSLRALGIPAQLDAVVLRALAKDPEDRFPSATEMREALVFLDADPAAAVGADPDATVLIPGAEQTAAEPDAPGHARTNRRRNALVITAALTSAVTTLIVVALLAMQRGANDGHPMTSTPAIRSVTAAASSLTIPGAASTGSARATASSARPTPSADASASFVSVPGDLVGESFGAANAELTRIGLKAQLAPGSVANPNALVTAALPLPGTVLARGSTVVLVVPANVEASSAAPATASAQPTDTAVTPSGSTSTATSAPSARPPSPTASRVAPPSPLLASVTPEKHS
jgi:serine/threonine-protein kinase